VAARAVLAIASHAHQHKAAPELLAREGEFEFALAQRLVGILPVLRDPEAPVPEHDGAPAVFALGDGTFEVSIRERMILDLDGKPLVCGIARGTLGHGPRLEDAVVLEAQVIVQPRGGMLLDDETGVFGAPYVALPAGLLGPAEIALAPIVGQFALAHG